MMWLRVAFTDAMTHAVSGRLLASLVADMAARGAELENFEAKYGAEHAAALGGNPKVIRNWIFDIGGPAHVERPIEVLEVDGLRVDVPCEQFGTIVRVVDAAPIRRFSSGDWYYKLKFWCHATVLTVEQRDHVLRTLEALHQGADQRAAAFAAAVRRGMAGVS